MATKDPPAEVAEIRTLIKEFFQQKANNGRAIGSAKCGVYAFFDYDGEPIYVGQTIESLSGRVGRHLTGRRSDAVAKFVLDPFEVLEIEVWPLWDAEDLPRPKKKEIVNAVERTVYDKALKGSEFGAVLNEALPPEAKHKKLPESFRGRIIPDHLFEDRAHPDIRIARRAQTIASLARLISERKIDRDLRQVLNVQAQRLAHLARRRFDDFVEEPMPTKTAEEAEE